MKAKVINIANMYGIVYVRDGKDVGRVLDNNCKVKMWKTRKGAEGYAKKQGIELA